MQHINLLGAHTEHVGLKPFATALYGVLGIVDGEERESGNYVGGSYLKGSRDGIAFTIALSDEEAHEDLPYWIHISADMEPDVLEAEVSRLVRDMALQAGFHLARIINFGKRSEERVDYQ
ncbi:hypothetical protein [Burkholderia ambifaria]|uniref:hypothetical protein n=1 Tax=Burkholderia ambifaria TaxID=152480 RepID=UPI001ABA2782|nr:hypothetical protein [Burkholderia ambifaria]